MLVLLLLLFIPVRGEPGIRRGETGRGGDQPRMAHQKRGEAAHVPPGRQPDLPLLREEGVGRSAQLVSLAWLLMRSHEVRRQ